MRFTQFYSGQNVCAPSRYALLTGKHMGHAAIRENSAHLLGKRSLYSDPDMKAAAERFQKCKEEDGFPGQLAMPASETTVAELEKLLREAHVPNKMFPMGALKKRIQVA